MRTSALILLLIVMLAPRLSAALPHALACAGTATGTPAVTSLSAAAHADTMAAGHHDHHQMMAAEHDSTASEHQHGDVSVPDSNNTEHNCQHCGQCDEHCSAVVLTALPQQHVRPGAEHPLSANAGQRAGFSLDLNRPPRTYSL